MKKLLFGVMTTVMVIMDLSVHLLVGILIYETCVRSSVEGAVASIILSLALLGMDAFNVYISRHTYDGTPTAKKALLAKMMVFDGECLEELEEGEL